VIGGCERHDIHICPLIGLCIKSIRILSLLRRHSLVLEAESRNILLNLFLQSRGVIVTMEDIPQPRALPLLGNLPDIDPINPVRSFEHLATKYGPIFKLKFRGKDTNRKYEANIQRMKGIAQDVITQRRMNPSDKRDC